MQPSIQVGSASNIYIRMMTFHRTGDREDPTPTNFDYIAYITQGAVEIQVDDIQTQFQAPHMVLVRAGLEHRFTALADNTVVNQIHAIREMTSDQILDPQQIPYASNPRLISSRPV